MKINNTVPAQNQLSKSSTVFHLGAADAPLKILILGNSITLHGPKTELGWSGDWGMAASAPEKDYVHRLFALLEERSVSAQLRIHQITEWERDFSNKNDSQFFGEDLAYKPDIVVFRFCENVTKELISQFRPRLNSLASHFSAGGAKILFTTSFWPSTAKDPIIRAVAAERQMPCAELGYTEEAEMALGQFEHQGVSLHPGDYGMEQIANRIYDTLKTML